MQFSNSSAELFVPDKVSSAEALKRTTHIAIGAHQDDLEIMAYHGILQCFGSADNWLCGVIVTDGAGSPRDDLYAKYTDEQMRTVRKVEQKKAAVLGEFGALALLDHPSSAVKDPENLNVINDLKKLILAAKPTVLYTHNPADKHDTHVGTALRTIKALRELPEDARPKAVYGCEVWRDLDWMIDEDKVAFDVSAHENLAVALLGVFDSQICGGKRYDLATIGRRRAHATYHASHGTDVTTQTNFAMDLTPLINDPTLEIQSFVDNYIQRLSQEVSTRINRLSGK